MVCGIIFVGAKSCAPAKTPETEVAPNGAKVEFGKPDSRRTEDYRRPYIPSEGRVEITPKDPTKKLEEVVEIKVRQYGFTFRPGFQLALPGQLGFDVKYFYYNRFGLNVGILTDTKVSRLDFDATVSYKLDRLKVFRNLEAFVGYTTKYDGPTGGLRINL